MPAAEIVVMSAHEVVRVAENSDMSLLVSYAPAKAGLRFQWYSSASGQIVTDGTGQNPKYSGATTSRLLIRGYDPLTDDAEYYCRVLHEVSGFPEDCRFSINLVSSPPLLRDMTLPDGRIGEYYNYEVLYFNYWYDALPSQFTATGLPKGLSIHPTTGMISGYPLEHLPKKFAKPRPALRLTDSAVTA